MLERDGLPAISLTADAPLLTAIANDYAYQDIFSKQIKALGKNGDVLLAISTSGKSPNIISAIKQARMLNLRVILMTGESSSAIKNMLSDNDIAICAPSKITPRIQEVHILIIHCLCDLIDRQLFGV
jgi:D-sedoheptulose 7-phosphate isomerase